LLLPVLEDAVPPLPPPQLVAAAPAPHAKTKSEAKAAACFMETAPPVQALRAIIRLGNPVDSPLGRADAPAVQRAP